MEEKKLKQNSVHVVRDIKRQTRRTFTSNEKIKIDLDLDTNINLSTRN